MRLFTIGRQGHLFVVKQGAKIWLFTTHEEAKRFADSRMGRNGVVVDETQRKGAD